MAALPATPAFAATSFTNPTPIAIPSSGSSGPAAPYPTEIAVSGLDGPITDMAVTLHRFGHTLPGDIDILLVSPSGDDVMLMSDARGAGTIEDFTWTFSEQAPRATSDDSSDCGEFTLRPTNYAGATPDSFGNTLPSPPHGTSLNDFNNENPNGTWCLFVMDDSGGEVGFFTTRFQLQIMTVPRPDTTAPDTLIDSGPEEMTAKRTARSPFPRPSSAPPSSASSIEPHLPGEGDRRRG